MIVRRAQGVRKERITEQAHETIRKPNDLPAVDAHKKSALDGSGCPTEAPYGCFLPDLTRFGTCRHPNPSNALGARYILPAPARWGKVANLGRGFFDYSGNRIGK